jgi:hypothetical protein
MKKSQLIELRSFIKQFLMEMPYRGALPAATPASKDDPDWEDNQKANANDRRQLDNFHRSKKFIKEANWAFEDFPQDIYILPASGFHGSNDTRTFSLEGQDAIDYIENELATGSGSSYVEDNDIESKLSSGATIIVSHIDWLKPGFLPTAWMVIHAICDSDPLRIANLNELVREISRYVSANLSVRDIRNCLTMKSAKTLSNTEGDGAAEIMVQELATRRGFHWKIPENLPAAERDELEEKFLGLKDIMSGFKEHFMASASAKSGMAIVVNTYPQLN